MEGHLFFLSRLRQGPARHADSPGLKQTIRSRALSLSKAQQDIQRETKVLANSEKDGYQKRPRQRYGLEFSESPLAAVLWIRAKLLHDFTRTHNPAWLRLK